MKLVFCLLLLTLLAWYATADVSSQEQPPNLYIAPGEEISMLCPRSPISKCLWYNPQGVYYGVSKHETKADGYIVYYTKDKCGLRLNMTTYFDIGLWTCYVENNYKWGSLEHNFFLLEARKPYKIELYNQGDAATNIFYRDQAVSVVCIVYGAYPKPGFTWYLDNVQLQSMSIPEIEDEDGNYSDTLIYLPMAEDMNKTLRCLVHHKMLMEEEREVSVIVEIQIDRWALDWKLFSYGKFILIPLATVAVFYYAFYFSENARWLRSINGGQQPVNGIHRRVVPNGRAATPNGRAATPDVSIRVYTIWPEARQRSVPRACPGHRVDINSVA